MVKHKEITITSLQGEFLLVEGLANPIRGALKSTFGSGCIDIEQDHQDCDFDDFAQHRCNLSKESTREFL
jgi:hypothetical protein